MNMVLAQFGASEVIQVYVLLMAIRRKPINPSNSKFPSLVFVVMVPEKYKFTTFLKVCLSELNE